MNQSTMGHPESGDPEHQPHNNMPGARINESAPGGATMGGSTTPAPGMGEIRGGPGGPLYSETPPPPRRTCLTRIPVVVHVVWNTAAQNIADAQVQSQIDVLNRDFRKLNPDAASIPAVWQPLVADLQVEFFMATV